ncbi:MFS transporter, partial [Candidatus Sumerlaeota bacterium]|nr:MFS transporter [Candidatus Sumerlaeota bacterium]
MEKTNYSKLSLMMFLQYAVWGAWLPVLAQYLQAPVAEKGLGFTGGQVGMILGLAGSIGAVTSPFIGNLADRKFSAERCLAVLMLIGGIVKWITAYQTSYAAWVILSIVYSIIYMPSISLSNSVAFANIKNADKEFPFIRVWGTIGWIAASWIFPWCFL